MYRSPAAPVIWWVWVAFALANLADIAVQGHDHFAAEIAAILVLITGVAYVAAFRPRVLADDAGITIRNPLRDHRVPWSCVTSVDLGDSLRVHCAWRDGAGSSGQQKNKVLYAWAVHMARRSRLRAEARARRSDRVSARRSDAYSRLPPEAREAMTKTDAEHTATALQQRAVRERAAAAGSGSGDGNGGGSGNGDGSGESGRPVASWSLPAIAALVLPALLVIVLVLV
jgi:hypothetical protein